MGAAPQPEEFRAELERIARCLVAPTENYEEIRFELRRFHDLCAEITGIRGDGDRDHAADLRLPGGTAISPAYAACTVFDWLRTKRFVYGLFRAIIQAGRHGPGPVHVLYAGCGPFATLALPIMRIVPATAAVWTMLEIQPAARLAASQLIKFAGTEDRVLSLVEADATVYRHSGPPFQILVSETMQNLLATEPQVGIFRNLVPQLARGGILIPEEIRVDIFLVDYGENSNTPNETSEETVSTLEFLCTLIQLNAETASGPESGDFPEKAVAIPAYRPWLGLRLQMTMRIFDEIRLEAGNSPLTVPRPLTAWRNHPDAKYACFYYKTGRHPGFRFRFE